MLTPAIYTQIHKKIRAAVNGKISNHYLTRPLPNNIQDLADAKIAYEHLYQDYKQACLSLIPWISYCSTQTLSIILSYLCPPFLSAEYRELAVLKSRSHIALSNRKTAVNTAIRKLGLLSFPELQDADERLIELTFQNIHQLDEQIIAAIQSEVQLIEMAEALVLAATHQVFDCSSIATWVVLELLCRGEDPSRIEIFNNSYNNDANDSHAFIVIGRKKNSNPKHMQTWGEECTIIDPWYGYCDLASKLYNNPKHSLQNYYLIYNLENKTPFKPAYTKEVLSYYHHSINQYLTPELQLPSTHYFKFD